jgi:hypothetical protein
MADTIKITEFPLDKLVGDSDSVFGFSITNYYALAREGKLPKPIDGKVDLIDAVVSNRKRIEHEIKRWRDLYDDLKDISSPKSRLQNTKADRELLKLKKEQGELIRAEVARTLWGMVIMNMKSKLLAMPTKLAPLITGLNKTAEIKEVIEKYTYEVANELSNPEFGDVSKYGVVSSAGGVKPSKATRKTKGKRVGRPKKAVKPGK